MDTEYPIRPLDSVCLNITDGSHFSPKLVETGYPYITVRDINDDKIDFSNCKYVSKDDFEALKKNGCSPKRGDLLFSKDGTVGKVAVVDTNEPFVVLSSLAIITPDVAQISPEFLFFVLKSPAFLREALGRKTGAAIRRIILKHLKSIEFPLPPLPVQKSIVAKLDAAFASIDTAIAAAEKNAENAKQLFQSYLSDVFDMGGEGWVNVKLRDVVTELMTGPFGSALHKSDYVDAGIPVINPQNLIDGKIIPLDRTLITERKRDELSKFVLKRGDIVIARRGEMGRCGLVDAASEGWLCGTGCMVIRLNALASEQFVYQLLQSSRVRKTLEATSIGATMNNLNQGILLDIGFALPPIEYQQQTLNTFTLVSDRTNVLSDVYYRKNASYTQLKQSLLQQAFSGQLVAA